MNFKKILPFIIVFIFLGFFVFYLTKNNNFSIKNDVSVITNTKYVRINGTKIQVELALTKKEQESGLSFRESLKNDEGMLFVFEKSDIYRFWMKDMSFPLDIIWINKDMKVVFIEKNVTPDTYPQAFGPNQESMYVLEVSAGFSEKNNLKENDSVFFLI